MTGYELRFADEIGRWKRPVAEAEMRHRRLASFFRVIDEIALCVMTGVAEDLAGILVGADGAVGAEAIEHRADDLRRFRGERRIEGQRRVRHVVRNADRVVILRL